MSKTKKTKAGRNKYQRGNLITAIRKLILKYGIENVSFEEMLKVAKSTKPDTAFDRSHFYYYRKYLRKQLKK